MLVYKTKENLPQVLHNNKVKFPKDILMHCSVHHHGRRDVRWFLRTLSSTKTSPQNIALQFRESFATIPARLCTLSSKPQIWWFYVVVMQNSAQLCAKMPAARAARSFSSFNQSHCFVALSLLWPSSFLELARNKASRYSRQGNSQYGQ